MGNKQIERNNKYIVDIMLKYNSLVRFKISLGDISMEDFYEDYLSESDREVWNEGRSYFKKSQEIKERKML